MKGTARSKHLHFPLFFVSAIDFHHETPSPTNDLKVWVCPVMGENCYNPEPKKTGPFYELIIEVTALVMES